MIRTSEPIIDEAFCAFQGYLGAHLLNALQGAVVVNPLHAAIFMGGCALTEKVAKEASFQFVPGTYSMVGPIPCGRKSLVSHGLAIYTTLKVMQIAGLILAVPTVVTYFGLASAAVLTFGCVQSLLARKPEESRKKSLEQQLEKLSTYTKLTNELLSFDYEGKAYVIRVVCNPLGKILQFSLRNGDRSLITTSPYIVACNQLLPQNLRQLLEEYLGDASRIYDQKQSEIEPLEFTENHQLKD